MRHRSGVTLIEVLITIFIMGIGMLALLTLFPVGALSMGRALMQDRATQAATNAEAIAFAQDIRHDLVVISDNNLTTKPTNIVADAFTNPFGTTLSNTTPGPSFGVFVDCWGYLVDTPPPGKQFERIGQYPAAPAAPINGLVGIPRRSISLTNSAGHAGTVLTQTECGRWCALTDDIVWTTTAAAQSTTGVASVSAATPDLSSNTPRRGLSYSWAWFLRRPNAFDPSIVEMSIVIYSDRSVSAGIAGETTYAATGTAQTHSVTITYAGARPNLRVGRWILDTSPSALNNSVPGYFYRVVDYTDVNATTIQLEVETPLKQNIQGTGGNPGAVVLLEDVVEVIDKGSGWQP
jgi:prepilin-type N-terminal cleavage/methylation domain-containing protein